jgi:hypothetical protein
MMVERQKLSLLGRVFLDFFGVVYSTYRLVAADVAAAFLAFHSDKGNIWFTALLSVNIRPKPIQTMVHLHLAVHSFTLA